MSLEEDWNKIVSQIRSSYPDRKIKQDEGMIEVNFDPSTFLTLRQGGFVEGSMPKHHFESSNAESVTIRNGITVVKGKCFEYLFKEE